MGRHGLKYCLLCNPYGNGTTGEDGTEAIGKYYLPKGEAEGQSTHGWIPVCESCAMSIDKYYDVEPVKGKENHPYFADKDADQGYEEGEYSHDWDKKNLVSQKDLTDKWECQKCGKTVDRKMGRPEDDGCPVPDEEEDS